MIEHQRIEAIALDLKAEGSAVARERLDHELRPKQVGVAVHPQKAGRLDRGQHAEEGENRQDLRRQGLAQPMPREARLLDDEDPKAEPSRRESDTASPRPAADDEEIGLLGQRLMRLDSHGERVVFRTRRLILHENFLDPVEWRGHRSSLMRQRRGV